VARKQSRIPEFDANGNLPPGIYHVSIEDIERRFTWTPRRLQLFKGLKRALANLSSAGVEKVWIDGSFVTNNPAPNDVDGCWEYKTGMNVEKLDKVFWDTNPPREAMKRKYHVDFFVKGMTLADAGGKFVEEFFQEDWDGNAKGIFVVDIRGLH
jgi:hypothetical protein